MKYTTIIAEKHSVAKEIAKVLGASTPHMDGPCGYIEGSGYRVTWAVGHLVGLLSPEEMGFTGSALPMFPDKWSTKILGTRGADGKFKKDPMKSKQMETIEKLFRDASEIIVATDAGREGELIFRYIYEYIGCNTPFRRLWISSLTDEAIRKGLRDLRDGHDYDSLSDAAHARARADWLVGLNASRMLRVATCSPVTLSLGRVQTPTLGMICSRYEENRNFTPVPYWQISIRSSKSGKSFTALSGRFEQENQAQEAALATKNGRMAEVTSVETKRTTTRPPLLYDITALQRKANSTAGLTASETLEAAQSLYESKLLSYPRTGSRYIPEDVFRTIPGLLAKMQALPQYGKHAAALEGQQLCKRSVNDSKVTDHHALLPTGIMPSKLTKNEQTIFDLVCARVCEAFGADSVADVTNATLNCRGTEYKAHGSIPVIPGWKAVCGGAGDEEKKKEDDDTDSGELPELAKGDIIPIDDVQILAKQTKPKPIHTDSSLLGEMETCGKEINDEELREAIKDCGLGTQATRANIIEEIIKRGYVSREKKKLIPTEKGLSVWNMVKGTKIADITTTGEWERDLGLVEKGKIKAETFNRGIKEFVGEILDDLKNKCTSMTAKRKCPCCGRTLVEDRWSLSCSSEGGCGIKIYKVIFGKALTDTDMDNLLAGKKTRTIKGFKSPKTGKEFDAALMLSKAEKKISFVFDETEKMEGKTCPLCGEKLADEKFSLSCTCGLRIPKSLCGVKLTEKDIDALIAGKTVKKKGFVSNTKNKTFDAGLSLSRENRKIDFVFDNSKKRK